MSMSIPYFFQPVALIHDEWDPAKYVNSHGRNLP
jgi:hypothetical protein